MGMDASPLDMLNVVTFTERMVKLAEYRRVSAGHFVPMQSTLYMKHAHGLDLRSQSDVFSYYSFEQFSH